MRDGRGTPGKYVLKNQPRLRLADLLKRRRMTLEQFLKEFGITAYETLVNRCDRMGVVAPTLEEFTVVIPEPINSPQEGIVVLEPAPQPFVFDAPAELSAVPGTLARQPDTEATEDEQKKQRKKKHHASPNE